MSNFLFNPIKVKMLNGSGDFDWLTDQIVGVLYDNRIVVTPDTNWATLSSFLVATSADMMGRSVTPTGQCRGDTLSFLGVTTQPGLRIVGMVLKFKTLNELIMNFTDGLDGFSGNDDLSLEAANLDIMARTSASNNSTWMAL
jgi:hypothetical protein